MKITSALYCSISLIGCSFGGSTYVTLEIDNGTDILHSRVRANEDVARFQCVASETGRCHYTVFVSRCSDTATRDACGDAPMRQFALPQGQRREFTGLQNFRLCVTSHGQRVGPQCRPLPRIASR